MFIQKWFVKAVHLVVRPLIRSGAVIAFPGVAVIGFVRRASWTGRGLLAQILVAAAVVMYQAGEVGR